MIKYKVQFHEETTDDEIIEADQYTDVDKMWIEFLVEDNDLLTGYRCKSRIASKLVARVDEVE